MWPQGKPNSLPSFLNRDNSRKAAGLASSSLKLMLSHFSHVRLCATLSLRFSRQEHWSGLPFPSTMHKSEKWNWSHSVMSDSLQPTRLLHTWDFPGKSTGVGCHCQTTPQKQTRSWVQGICHCSHWLQRPSSWAETPFHVPQFLIIGNKLYSWPFLTSNQQGQTPAKGKEYMWRQGRTVRRNSSAALGQGLGFPQGIHVTASLSCLQILKPLPGGRS